MSCQSLGFRLSCQPPSVSKKKMIKPHFRERAVAYFISVMINNFVVENTKPLGSWRAVDFIKDADFSAAAKKVSCTRFFASSLSDTL